MKGRKNRLLAKIVLVILLFAIPLNTFQQIRLPMADELMATPSDVIPSEDEAELPEAEMPDELSIDGLSDETTDEDMDIEEIEYMKSAGTKQTWLTSDQMSEARNGAMWTAKQYLNKRYDLTGSTTGVQWNCSLYVIKIMEQAYHINWTRTRNTTNMVQYFNNEGKEYFEELTQYYADNADPAKFNEGCRKGDILPGDIVMFFSDKAGTATVHTAMVSENYAGTAGHPESGQFGIYHAWYDGSYTSALGKYNGTMETTLEEAYQANGPVVSGTRSNNNSNSEFELGFDFKAGNGAFASYRVYHLKEDRPGQLKLTKVSAHPEVTASDPFYKTDGAFYGLYSYTPGSNVAESISAYRNDPWGARGSVQLINMQETKTVDGKSIIKMDDIKPGNYILIEVAASQGFQCDTDKFWYVIVDKNGNTTVQPKSLIFGDLNGAVTSPYGSYASATHEEEYIAFSGGLCLVKGSTNTALTNNNPAYSCNGALYGLYKYSSGQEVGPAIAGYRADAWGSSLVAMRETSYTNITYTVNGEKKSETVDGAFRIDDIANGDYILIEVWPPNGFEIDNDTYWYVHANNGAISVHKKSIKSGDLEPMVTGGKSEYIKLNHADKPYEPGWLQFQKTAIITGKELDPKYYDLNGALYGLYTIPANATDAQAIAEYRKNGYSASTPYLVSANLTAGNKHSFKIDSIVAGDYLLVELLPGKGFLLDTDTYWKVNVANNGTTKVTEKKLSKSISTEPVVFTPGNKDNYATYVVHNEDYSVGTIKVHKTNKNGSDLPMKGAEYTIYDADGTTPIKILNKNVVMVIDETNWAESPELPYGDYVVKETKAPAQYDLDPEAHKVSINPDTVASTVGTVVESVDAEQFGSFRLLKKSSAPNCTNNNSNYSLEGAEFTLSGTAGTFKLVTNKDGIASVTNVPVGTYRLKETKAPKGFALDTTISGTKYKEINIVKDKETTYTVTDPANVDPITITVNKTNGDGSLLTGAEYTLKYYEFPMKGDPATVNNPATGKPYQPTRVWKIKTGDGTNGTEKGKASLEQAYLIAGSDALFTDSTGKAGLPVGTVTVQETKAPNGYVIDPTMNWYYNDGVDIEKSWKPASDDPNNIELSNTADFRNYAVPVNLEIIKKDADTTKAQGSAGDTTIKGAVFAIYAKRDIVDDASGVTKVTKSGTYTERTALKFSDGTAIKDQFGNQVYAEKGDPIPLKIFAPTDEQGKTKLTGFTAAKNADDYYVRELVAPKGFLREVGDIAVDMRDLTDKSTKIEQLEKSLTVTNKPFKQSVRIFKYENMEVKLGETGAVALQGVEFQVYLLSSLKNLKSVPTVTNADGTVGYNFDGYDFSKETPEIVTDKGGRTLVTDAEGFATTIPLRAGTYVLVETKELEGYHKLDPIVFSIPQMEKNADGSIKYENGNPIVTPLISLNVENDIASAPIKINKRDAKTTELVTRSNATFSIWDVTKCTEAQQANPKENGTRVSQSKLQEDGTFVAVDSFVTDSEGFLLLQKELRYGVYAIVEEVPPAGYDKADPVYCKVALDGLYVKVDGNWIKATKYTDTNNKIYYEVNVSDQPFELDVAKINDENGTWVEGAEMTIYKAVNANGDLALDGNGKAVVLEARDESGKFVKAIWNTSNKFKHFEVVPSGWYVLRETKTPAGKGYATMDDFVFFVGEDATVAPNGKRTVTGTEAIHYSYETITGGLKLKAVDSKQLNTKDLDFAVTDKPVVLEISKVNATDSKELPGAKLTLYRIEGSKNVVVDTWTSGTTPHVVKYVQPGKYKLVEDVIPNGFYNDKQSIEFDVLDTAEVQKVKMINYPTSTVEVSKIDATNSEEVPGATLELYSITNDKKFLIDTWVSGEVPHVVKNLKPGKYCLNETIVPEGYYATSTEITFDVETYGITKKVEMVNYPKSTAEISKVDATNGAEVPGAGLALYHLVDDESINLVEEWISSDVPHVVKNLMPGKYRLVENTLPLGYFATENTVEFEVETYGIVKQVEMVNHPIVASFDKKLKGTSTSIAGATMALYRLSEGPAFPNHLIEDGAELPTLVDRWVTDGTPYEIKCLYPGDYKLVEEVAPDGYTVADPIEFTVTDTKQADPITMYDEKINCWLQIHKQGEALTRAENTTCEYGDYTKFIWEQVNLAGVKFELYNEAGELVETLETTSEGNAFSSAIPFGTYKVREIVPEGWVDDHVEYTITFSWSNGMTEPDLIAELNVDNKACNTEVEIFKTGEDPVFENGEYVYKEKPLSGVLFGIYAAKNITDYYGNLIANAGACVGYAVTDEAGVAKFDTKLVRGEYYYKELATAGPQYVIDENVYNFDILLQNNQLASFKLNESTPILNRYVRGGIKVLKVNADGKRPLAGAEFDLFNSNDTVIGHLVTGVDGTVQTGLLPYGKYYLIETKAPEGFQRVDTAFEVSVEKDNEIVEITIENTDTPKLGANDVVKIGITVFAFLLSLTILFFTIRRRVRR